MKRQLSLVLALVMILGSFSSVFAAVSVDQSAVNVAGKFLKAEGVLEGDDGNLMLDANLKRRDAVVLISRLLGEEEEAKVFPSEDLKFTDLTDDYYNGYIAWSVAKEIIEGHTGTTLFGFNEEMTAQQFATVLLRVLGHEVNDEAYPKALELAEELGLLIDIEDLENGTVVTRGMMALMTFNALYVEVKGTGKTLAETLGIEMPEREVEEATELTGKVKDTENLKEVVLELSNAKLVDADKLENVNNYKVVGNEIVKAEIQGNDVIILLRDALLDGREYKLRVRSIDKAINKEHTFKAKDNTIPSVEKVEVLGKNGIKLITSEPINILENVRGRTFEVDGKNIAMDVEVYGRNVILTPYYSETFSKDVESLTISGLADFAGFKTAKEVFPIEMVEDKVAPKVTDVIMRTDKKVEVVFDKDVYVDSVGAYYDKNDVGNISYESGRHNVYATKATKIDTNKVVYEFKDEFLRKRTDFTIVGVENHSGIEMEKTIEVAREILDNVEPEMYKQALKSVRQTNGTMNTTITLYFDKDVYGVRNAADNGFEIKDHFKLYEREIFRDYNKDSLIKTAEYAKDAKGEAILDTVVVNLEGLTEWNRTNETDYILEVEGFATDNSLRRSRMYRDYYEFKAQQGTGFAIVTDGIEVTGNKYETQINIEFNKPVDRNIAEDNKYFIFNHKTLGRQDVDQLKGRIVTEKDGYEVTIILPDFDVTKYDSFRILDTLKTRAGERLDRVYVYDFETGFADNAKYTIVKETNGRYTVTPKSGVTEMTLKTNIEGNFDVVGSGLTKLVIDAPKGHVTLNGISAANPANIGIVEIITIGPDSLEIGANAVVTEVVVKTDKVFSIYGNKANDIKIRSTVENAKVKIGATKDTVVVVELVKGAESETAGNIIEGKEDAKVEAELNKLFDEVLNKEVEVKEKPAAKHVYVNGEEVKEVVEAKIKDRNIDVTVEELKIKEGTAKVTLKKDEKSVTKIVELVLVPSDLGEAKLTAVNELKFQVKSGDEEKVLNNEELKEWFEARYAGATLNTDALNIEVVESGETKISTLKVNGNLMNNNSWNILKENGDQLRAYRISVVTGENVRVGRILVYSDGTTLLVSE